jgi:hypothetical protein
MRMLAIAVLVSGFLLTAHAADSPSAKLTVKPQLCVLDRDDAGCQLAVHLQWAARIAADYCVSVDLVSVPLRCWERTSTGELRETRTASQDFTYWLQTADNAEERLAAAKVQVLRIGSNDRRRERRTRHAWDVL